MPITRAVVALLDGQLSPAEAVVTLMGRDPATEFARPRLNTALLVGPRKNRTACVRRCGFFHGRPLRDCSEHPKQHQQQHDGKRYAK